ncbi:BglG family transcription antiterminator [Halobacillus salinarum]|uniref:Ascorbate-specific PTS system EIIA component n=1 Tax=Halobacillus salinarum TaxID=2932257 RepID=A0ABY4ENJ9_9BACI|nr:BglG family transcription antiterminator [Halobacillus salinarum]UOQ45522.1 BglG family transcription antiterminator [Halobacillus salinarum]
MSLDERSKNILDELVSNPSITSTTLENKYEITRRQLGYSFTKINDWLMAKNLPVIERTRKGHFLIDQSVFTNLNGEDESTPVEVTVLSEEQRVYLLLMLLLSSKEELSLHHFTVELDVSKNTVLNDLKQAQAFLNDYELTIRYSRRDGYLLEGKEFQIRKLLITVTYQLLHMNLSENRIRKLANISLEEIEEFHRRIERVENKLNLKFTDEKLATMPYIIILILRRIGQGKELQFFSIKYEELSNTKEYLATEELFRDTGEIPMQERLFFTLHLLTTNVYWSEYLTDDDATQKLVPVIDNMLRLFEKSACIYLQDRDQLVNKLLQHIKPAFYRIKYQLTETIDIQDSLNKEIKELHHLVKRSIGPLEDFIGKRIPESETTFITMLIGGWMRRQGDSIDKKTKAIVVCPQGVSVSRLMFSELRELFPGFVFLDSLSVREFLDYELEYDLVFSPTYLETDKKLFISKPFLSEEEKYRLRKQVMLELHGYIPNDINVQHLLDIVKTHADVKNEQALTEELQRYIDRDEEASVTHNVKARDIHLNELIPPDHIKLRDSAASWADAIRLCARPLIEAGKIEQEYVEAMIHRSEEDPYIVIGPNMAIPHAAPDEGVNEVSMSLLRLKKGVDFTEDYRIHLIVVIAAVDKQQHIHALMQLMKLAGSEADRNRIIHADTVDEIYQIIQDYSTDKDVDNN